jgi:hypothetical protein
VPPPALATPPSSLSARRVRGRDVILMEHRLMVYPLVTRVEGIVVHGQDLARMLKLLARNLHGTPSCYEPAVAVKPQASGLQGREGGRSDSKIVSSGARQRTGLVIAGPVAGWPVG